MDWAFGEYKGIIGEHEFELKRQEDDKGLSFFLGLEKGVPERIIQISKEYVYRIWAIRESEKGRWKQEINRKNSEEIVAIVR